MRISESSLPAVFALGHAFGAQPWQYGKMKRLHSKSEFFSELVTADYIMVSPFTARGYGIFEEIKDQFRNSDDPFEYIPARLHALKSRDGKVQESRTDWYPHAGFLSMFHYLRRYPSTETNRNRLRARISISIS